MGGWQRYDGSMAVTHISDTEAVRDFAGVLAKVKAGEEIVIESEAKPIAFLRPAVGRLLSEGIALAEAKPMGRLASEAIAIAEESPEPVMDEDFAKDMREIIANRKPRKFAQWD